ncbi:hypothetical protein BsWGS_18566 [Bradybaena similaris]
MSTTSKKHQSFVSGPMGEKSVNELAGIGDALGKRLSEKGINKAYSVLGHFLILEKDQDKFKKWLHDNCNANSQQQEDCYNCLKEWCDSFL